jgi:hypothetical protein
MNTTKKMGDSMSGGHTEVGEGGYLCCKLGETSMLKRRVEQVQLESAQVLQSTKYLLSRTDPNGAQEVLEKQRAALCNAEQALGERRRSSLRRGRTTARPQQRECKLVSKKTG